MAMRLSGLMSGMDTESIIQQLVAAKQTKVDTQKKAQTKLSWKQDAWKDLNTKLKNLQQKYIGNMRFISSYSKKTTNVSNSSVVSVITGENAVEGVQNLEVNQLAKTGYLTGAKIGNSSDPLTALSTMGDLGFSGSGSFMVKAGDKSVDINVTESTTISDILTQIKEAGINANFDEKQQRLFISSKKSGEDYDFSITATDAGGMSVLSALGIQEDLSSESAKKGATYKEYEEYAQYYNDASKADELNAIKANAVASKVDSYLTQYKDLTTSIKDANDKLAELQQKDTSAMTDEELEQHNKDLTDAQTNLDDLNAKRDALSQYITVSGNEDDGFSAEATEGLKQQVSDTYDSKVKMAYDVVNGNAASAGNYATKVTGQNARITLNGAEFVSNDNVFEINGLTFTALSETKPGESVTVTTSQDTDGIYDMVKNFLKEYNAIINEMDKLYNADSAKGYEPLTDDEKDAMSDSEVEKYETKIKDALLRGDDTLSSISSALQGVMSSGIEVNGKTMYLYDFGIETLGYFASADNEKHAYHIDGDPDDSDTSGNADKLKSMISSDPDTVISFFTKLSQNLYSKMSDLSSSVQDYRSYGSFYEDKKMKTEYDNYTTKIAELEAKLNDYEDKWYSKFSAMETAMAKMQSNASAVTALLGG